MKRDCLIPQIEKTKKAFSVITKICFREKRMQIAKLPFAKLNLCEISCLIVTNLF